MEELTIDEIKKLNLFEKMTLIADEIGVIQKNLNVGTGNGSYKAVAERDVIDAVKPIERKYRVFSYPSQRSVESSENFRLSVKDKYCEKETVKIFLRLKTTYNFVNIDNPAETIFVESLADGFDSQDKASGKAMTYADKYALMKAYKIATGDDPDKDASQDIVTKTYKNSISADNVKRCKDSGVTSKQICDEYKIDSKDLDDKIIDKYFNEHKILIEKEI